MTAVWVAMFVFLFSALIWASVSAQSSRARDLIVMAANAAAFVYLLRLAVQQ
jgi:hypothetical protein